MLKPAPPLAEDTEVRQVGGTNAGVGRLTRHGEREKERAMDGSVSTPRLFDTDERTRRSRRVIVLLIGIIVLSVADLVMTLSYLRTIGMTEANPIAVLVIESTRSALSLTCFKLLTVLVTVLALYRIRGFRTGEVGAWIAVAVLTLLVAQWHIYSSHFAEPENIGLAVAGAYDDVWMRLE
jgi:hypothetical protein